MTLRPPNERAYERILAFGGPGAGKTKMWLDVALRAQTSGSDATFYVIDTDFAVPRMMTGKFAVLENVVDEPVADWDALMEAVTTFSSKVQPHDWLVFDMVSYAWEAVQDHYTAKVFGTDLGSFFMAASKKAVDAGKHGGGSFEQDRDWGAIKKLYSGFSAKILRAQCHVFATAAMKGVSERDSEDLRKTFARFGGRPEGEKHTAHLFHTVLMAAKGGQDDYRITSVKDRERGLLEGESWEDFSLAYLVKKARWRP